ncbi:MAG: hypothetical protein WCP12_17990 [bacterium]
MKLSAQSMGLLILMVVSVQAAIVVPLPPFTVYGKVRNWNGRAFSGSDAATVIVKVKGVEVSRCNAQSGSYPALNYRVQIPMANSKMAGRGEVGDPITFEIYYDGQMHAVAAGKLAPTVVRPAGTLCCDLIVGTDSDSDGLPDEYESLLMYYYDAAGRGSNLEDIKPGDDFDGDGYSNLQEFQAGTIPVEKADFLKITDFSMLKNGFLALSFLSAPGRTYTLPTKKHASSNDWSTAAFATSTNEAPAETHFTSEQDANITLYLLPTTNTPALFRLEAQ